MTTRTSNPEAALERRVRQFYTALNQREFERCYRMIDPRVHDRPRSITLLQHEDSLRRFLERFGPINLLEVCMTLYVKVPNKLYEGRDFAMGETIWLDGAGERRTFTERWVRDGRVWYTRCTGYVTPEPQKGPSSSADAEAEAPRTPKAPKKRPSSEGRKRTQPQKK